MADPRKDPYFKDAYSTENAYLQDFLKNWTVSRNNALNQEQEEIQIEEARRKQGMRTKLSEVLAAGGEGSIADRIKPVLAEYGDVDSLLQFEKEDRLEDQAGETKKQREMNTIFKIAEVNPELATQMWNANFGELGMMTPEKFQKPPQIKSGPGMLYHVDKDGKIVIDYKMPEKDRERAPAKQELYSTDGGKTVKFLDVTNPEHRQMIEQGGWREYKEKTQSETDKVMAQFMRDAMGLQPEEESAPVPSAVPVMPQAAPVPTATPFPTKMQSRMINGEKYIKVEGGWKKVK